MFFRLQMFDLDSDKELFLIKLPNEVKLTIISQLFVYNYIIKQLIKYQKKFNDLTLDFNALKHGDRFKVVIFKISNNLLRFK